MSFARINRYGFVPDTDTFTIIYMVLIYPLIPTNVSAIAILLMAVPTVIKIVENVSRTSFAVINKKIMPLMLIPLFAAISGGITAIAYAAKIGITIFNIALLQNKPDKNYTTFLRVICLNGIVVLFTMYFEYFFRNIAITLYRPIWNLYLHGNQESLLQSVLNAENGACYGIIPSASYAVNALTFALGTYLTKKQNVKNRIMILLMYIGIFMTSKRSYMVFVSAVIFILMFLVGERRTLGNRLLGGLFLLLMFLMVWRIIEPYITYSPTGIGKLLATIKYFNDPIYIEKYYIRAERDVLGAYAIELFKNNWVFGVGWGNFSKLYLQDTGIWRLDAHNTYLQILCESGIFVAAIIFGLLFRELFYSFKTLKKNRKQYYYMTYVITFTILISFTAFLFDLTQLYVTPFFCVYFMRNISGRSE